jgi:purine-binding chemotaxis protein CheW
MDIAKIRKKLKKTGARDKKKRKKKAEEAPHPEHVLSDEHVEGTLQQGKTRDSDIVARSVPEELPDISEREEQAIPPSITEEGKSEIPESISETDDEGREILCFFIGPEIYALHMSDIQEIVRFYSLTSVPKTPEHLEGIVSLRGKIVPVFNLKRKFHVNDMDTGYSENRERGMKKNSLTQKIIIARGPKGSIGLITDRVIGVKRVLTSNMKEAPTSISDDEAKFIESVAIDEGKFISILRISDSLILM